jgi:hypothetical protein
MIEIPSIPLQIPSVEPPGPQSIFQRGRLDHFALNAANMEAFREFHRRVVAEGASDGVVTDMGSLLLFTFTDPDAGKHEIVWMKPGMPITQGMERANWTTVELD